MQSGRIRQENSEVRALRMVFLRNALLRLHHRRRRRRTTGSETRKTERRAEPREEERSATERKPAPRPRACRRFHSLLNHQTSEGIRILCVSSSTVGPGEAGRGTGGRDDSFASPSTTTSSRIAHLHRGTASRGGDETRVSPSWLERESSATSVGHRLAAPQSVCNKGRCIVGG